MSEQRPREPKEEHMERSRELEIIKAALATKSAVSSAFLEAIEPFTLRYVAINRALGEGTTVGPLQARIHEALRLCETYCAIRTVQNFVAAWTAVTRVHDELVGMTNSN
jgi:hypothetical protein